MFLWANNNKYQAGLFFFSERCSNILATQIKIAAIKLFNIHNMCMLQFESSICLNGLGCLLPLWRSQFVDWNHCNFCFMLEHKSAKSDLQRWASLCVRYKLWYGYTINISFSSYLVYHESYQYPLRWTTKPFSSTLPIALLQNQDVYNLGLTTPSTTALGLPQLNKNMHHVWCCYSELICIMALK